MKTLLMCASRTSHLVQFHLPYLRWFHAHGWQVETVSQGPGELPGIHWELPFRKRVFSPKNAATLLRLTALLRRRRYDLIVAHTSLAGLLTRAAAALAGCRARLVQVCHGYLFRDDGSLKSRLFLWCEKRFSPDCLLVMNGEDAAIARKYRLCSCIREIPGMGLSTAAFPKDPEAVRKDMRRSLGLRREEILLLCVGEFSPRKNQMCLLRAFSRIAAKFPQARLYLAGEGETLTSCQKWVRRHGLETQVVFLGQRRDIPALLAACDGLVSASRCEGLPFSVMEALYLKKPVAVSDIKGHRELVIPGENGVLFSLKDREGAEKALTALLERPKESWNPRDMKSYLISAVMPQVLEAYLGKGET